jgi:subtilisin family serine protease
MRLLAALPLGLALLFAMPPVSAAGPERPAYREGELLVQFRPDTPEAARERVHQRVKSKPIKRLKGDVHHIALPPQLGVQEALAIYRADPVVEYAEPNRAVWRALTPTDSRFSEQWYLNNIGQRFFFNRASGTSGVDIGALKAWDLHTGSGDIIVAVLDSGLDYLHADLAANSGSGWNFVSGNSDPMDDDPSSHGTHIAGVIGAVGNNGRGVSGINWRVRLMPLKFLDAKGSGSVAHAIAAIDYAVAMGARVINASYGYPNITPPEPCRLETPSVFERQAIERALSAGVLFVAAAGNSGCNNDDFPFYPASHKVANIISVAASDANDRLATFSNYGPNSVHLAAPGDLILSTLHRSRGEYGYLSGTSMAAPMVSGLAALLLSYRPELPMPEARQLILDNSLRLSVHTGNIAYGRLNASGLLATEADTPMAPGNLMFQDQGADFLELRWEDRSSIEESYALERRVGINGAFTVLVMLPADTETYRDETGSDVEGSAFSYRVRAVAQGKSSFSNEAALVAPPLAPQALQADIDQTGVLLSWEDHSQVESGYELERRSGSLPFQRLALLKPDSIDYFDEASRPATYTYRLRALHDLAGPSAWSEEVTVSLASPSAVPDGDVAAVSPSSSGGGGCFIATAAYGSPLHPQVAVLRQFRDEVLLSRWWGRWINDAYLRLSPTLARMVEQSDGLRAVVRTLLRPVISVAGWWFPAANPIETHPLTTPAPG